MSNALKIRELTIVKFEKDNDYHRKRFCQINSEWIKEELGHEKLLKVGFERLGNPQKYILENDGEILLAILDNEIIGSIGVYKRPEGVYEIARFGVVKEQRGKKIGDSLFSKIIDICQEKGIKKVYLVTTSTLIPAIALYKKYGFSESPLALHLKSPIGDTTMEKIL